jgi:hypothetical protein
LESKQGCIGWVADVDGSNLQFLLDFEYHAA